MTQMLTSSDEDPRGDLDSDLAAARAAVWPFIERLKAKPEVEGILIISSAAVGGDRATFDRDSDFDLTVFVASGIAANDVDGLSAAQARARHLAALPGWLPDFSFYVPVPWGELELNVHQRVLEKDASPDATWDESMSEAHHLTVEVVYDRSGAIGELLARHTHRSADQWRDQIIRLVARLSWDLRRLPERQLGRGDPVAAHYMVTTAVEELIEIAHVLGRRFLPHRKWQFRSLRANGLATTQEIGHLSDALLCRDFSRTEFERRCAALHGAWASIRGRLPAGLPADAYQYYSARISTNRQLHPATVASQLAELLGGEDQEARDLVNFLLPADTGELAALLADPDVAQPSEWAAARERVRRVLVEATDAPH
jgi:Domain of unknown function (DUF4037)